MNNYLTYIETKNIIQQIKNINHVKDFTTVIKKLRKVDDLYYKIPLAPEQYYKNNGWEDWSKFTGNNIRTMCLSEKFSLKYLKNIAIKNNIKSNKNWKIYASINNLPVKLNNIYKNKGWISWGIFLDNKRNKIFLSYNDAVKYVNKLLLKSVSEYIKYVRDNNINFLSTAPDGLYKNKGWKSWSLYLGYDNLTTNSSNVVEIEFILMKYHIPYVVEKRFDNFKKYPFDIYLPLYNLIIEYDGIQHFESHTFYNHKTDLIDNNFNDNIKNEWAKNNNINLLRIPYYIKNLNNYILEMLPKYNIKLKKENYFTYEECKKYLKALLINNMCIWYDMFKSGTMDIRVPYNPYVIYKNYWKDWNDIFGMVLIKNSKYLSYNDAKQFLYNLKINSNKKWNVYLKNKHSFIPSYPKRQYKREFVSMSDFLCYNSARCPSSYPECE